MKKKIKNLTIKDIKKIHSKHKCDGCIVGYGNCPLTFGDGQCVFHDLDSLSVLDENKEVLL